jgi:hypothetical protein
MADIHAVIAPAARADIGGTAIEVSMRAAIVAPVLIALTAILAQFAPILPRFVIDMASLKRAA